MMIINLKLLSYLLILIKIKSHPMFGKFYFRMMKNFSLLVVE